MSESSDFTFCQVGLRVDEENLESPKTFLNINNMTIRDDSFGGGSANQPDTSLKKDSYADNPSSKVSGIDTYLPLKVSEILPPNSKVSKSLHNGSNVESVSGSQESKLATKRPVQRVKVPFEKGYSQMDWLKITRTHPDLAGLKGQSNRRLISMDEVKQHKSDGSIWTVLKGRVYNISAYMKFHPGGVDMLMKAAGKDCTLLFNKYHAWVNAEFLLEKCLVGVLDDSK